MSAAPDPAGPDRGAALAALVVRQGVGIGRLSDDRRQAALAVAAVALAPDEAPGEREVTARLRDWLAGPAAFLDTDAAELRRWLVDTGWWTRDGFGQAYRRADPSALAAGARAWADALAAAAGADTSTAVAAWVATRVDDETRRRAARRAAAGVPSAP